MDVDLTTHRLVCTTAWMRTLTRVPANAHIAYEGAPVALADLLPN